MMTDEPEVKQGQDINLGWSRFTFELRSGESYSIEAPSFMAPEIRQSMNNPNLKDHRSLEIRGRGLQDKAPASMTIVIGAIELFIEEKLLPEDKTYD